ncbi:MAG: hypothetical protein JW776_14135 [Candidatus Lokiarchaeota archaeon]|nr:hypothetical protein [Candidatus Lokiarchaeota archaeon]
MKHSYVFLLSVLVLLIISTICLGLMGYYNLSISIVPTIDGKIILLIIVGSSLGLPIVIFLIISCIKFVQNLVKPKFLRIAGNLEHFIKRNKNINRKLKISQRKELVIQKMELIWRKVDMHYPLSELNFEKLEES